MTLPGTVVFDLDGTLVDTAPDLTAALNHVLGLFDRPPVPPEDVRMMVGHGARRLLERGLAATGEMTQDLVDAGFQPFLDFYAANIMVGSRAYAGAEATLDALRGAGCRLAICTNKPTALSRQLIAALGWSDRFDANLGADAQAYRKPDPRHLLDAIALAGGRRDDAAYVGDSITDVETAKAAGVPVVAVTFGFSDRPVRELGADALIDRFDELQEALTALVVSRRNGQLAELAVERHLDAG